MVSVKEKLKINKIRNKKEKVKQNIKNKEEKKKKTNKHKFWYYLLSFITLIAIIMVFCVIGFIIYIVKNAPTFNEEDLYNKASSVIYASDNSVIATLGMSVGNDEVETRTLLTYEELPEVLIDAVVATEDSRFFQHNGVDLARFIKASIGQVFGQDGNIPVGIFYISSVIG